MDSYHGYGIHDFLVAEPRFAASAETADAELRNVVDAAHTMGLWVILDIVLNHVGNVFAYSPDDPGTVPGVPFSPQPLPVYWRLPDGTPRPDPTPSSRSPGLPAATWSGPASCSRTRTSGGKATRNPAETTPSGTSTRSARCAPTTPPSRTR